jgi:hypothetical protein
MCASLGLGHALEYFQFGDSFESLVIGEASILGEKAGAVDTTNHQITPSLMCNMYPARIGEFSEKQCELRCVTAWPSLPCAWVFLQAGQ